MLAATKASISNSNKWVKYRIITISPIFEAVYSGNAYGTTYTDETSTLCTNTASYTTTLRYAHPIPQQVQPNPHVPTQPPIATTPRYAHLIPQQVQPNPHVHHPTMLQQHQNMGESKVYNITAAPQQTSYNPRSQEQAKYNKRIVAHDNRVSISTKSMSQHHQINPQSDLRKVDIKISGQIFAQPEIQSHLENDMGTIQ